MKSFIIGISAALIVGTVYSQSPPALTPDSTLNGAAAPVGNGMNPTTAGNLTHGTETAGGLNGTSALNATAMPMSSSLATNGTSSIFVMDQKISWANSNFTVFYQNGTAAYLITNQYAGANLTPKEFIVQDAISGEKKLRVDSRVKACGFGQSYEADDGTTFELDTRAFLSDRWRIKDADSEYTFKRHALSVQGSIFENERVVAHATTQAPKQLVVTSDGSISPWDLIALIALAKARVHTCGY